ncbi:hypothetical protein EV182_004605 [Spiromyces aspiralis]|uniref:Uncharacterized protein n=1 Tax=Spiromyces aspiralis TaxID=68401 RepID=A0ACC1HBQ5_9FUNG|nr:hypothetical protein EV182_004605 [Spiromyces aspiralis]
MDLVEESHGHHTLIQANAAILMTPTSPLIQLQSFDRWSVAQAKVETLAEDILTDKQLSIDYDKKRNENRQALRALKKPNFGKKATINLGDFFIDIPVTKAMTMVEEDQKHLEAAIEDVRERIKTKTAELHKLEGNAEDTRKMAGFDLKPITADELYRINKDI